MENFAEIDFIATRLYEVAKTDFHTLQVDGSSNKMDYSGNFNVIGGKPERRFVTIDYDNISPPGLDYIGLLQICHYIIIGMLKRDIKLWSKAGLVEDFWFSPKVDCRTRISMSLTLKAMGE